MSLISRIQRLPNWALREMNGFLDHLFFSFRRSFTIAAGIFKTKLGISNPISSCTPHVLVQCCMQKMGQSEPNGWLILRFWALAFSATRAALSAPHLVVLDLVFGVLSDRDRYIIIQTQMSLSHIYSIGESFLLFVNRLFKFHQLQSIDIVDYPCLKPPITNPTTH